MKFVRTYILKPNKIDSQYQSLGKPKKDKKTRASAYSFHYNSSNIRLYGCALSVLHPKWLEPADFKP